MKENQQIEFKPNFNEDVIETLVAFANTQGGRVLVGVNDKGLPISSFRIGKESIQNWLNEIKNKTQPSILPDVKVMEHNGVEIIEFKIPEYPVKPVACRGKYYKRVLNSNHQMSLSEISDLYLKTFNMSWDYYIDSQHSLDAISVEKINLFIAKRLQGNNNEDPLHLLQKYDLIRDGRITNAAYLLFVNGFSPLTGIQAGRFKSATKIIDSVTISTDLFTEVDELMSFVRKHLMMEYIITGNVQREERFDYPEEAIREIVLNMIVHRDYRESGDSIVKIFDDRIEFFNPGTLIGGLTIEQLLSDNYTPKSRNTLVNIMFKETGAVEKYGSGIHRIINECERHGGVKVDFNLQQHGFKVTITKIMSAVAKDVNDVTKEILILIANNSKITIDELSTKINVDRRTILRKIEQLKKENKLERKGGRKDGKWIIK